MPTPLRHDFAFLKRLIIEAIKLHRPRSAGHARMLADLRDYLMYLTLDAISDEDLARILVERFTKLQAWLQQKLQSTHVWHDKAEAIRFYMGWLFALEQLLSLRHQIALLPGEKISRQDFMQSWKHTALKLRLPFQPQSRI